MELRSTDILHEGKWVRLKHCRFTSPDGGREAVGLI